MYRTLLSTAVAVALALPAAADVAANKDTVLTALGEVFGKGNAAAVDTYFADPYIQHNPMMPSGVAPLKGMVKKMADSGRSVDATIHRVIGEGDLVATHTTYVGFGPKPMVAFDVFRLEDGKIVEHWDNLQVEPEQPNPSGRTMTDGATEITDLDKTEANKAVVMELIEKAFIKGEKIDITQYISPVTYLQHNPMAGDGLKGLGEMMASLKEKGIKMYYTSTPLVVAEGNFVLTGSEGVFGDKEQAFYDLFRLEDGLIVEHWDVIADMPGEKVAPGFPGKF